MTIPHRKISQRSLRYFCDTLRDRDNESPMKIRYLRWIDKHIGVIACGFLSGYERVCGWMRRNDLKPPDTGVLPSKVLIIKFWGFGSIILARQAFQALRRSLPCARICVLTLKQNAPAYKMLGIFDEVHGINIDSLFGFLPRMARSLFCLRTERFDAAVDLEFTSRFSAIVTYLSSARRRVGFRYKGVWRGSIFTDSIEFSEDTKLRQSYMDLIRAVPGVNVEPGASTFVFGVDEGRAYVDGLLRQEGITDGAKIVGMNVNASELCLLRRWPREYFVELAKRLINTYSAHIIFIGSKAEQAYVRGTAGNIAPASHVHNFSGKTTLEQLAHLLSRMRLFVTNDSGPLHLAASMGVPTVSFFGPETPVIYGPEGQRHAVFYNGLECSPCIRIKNYKHSRCPRNNQCLRGITPDEVAREIERKRFLR